MVRFARKLARVACGVIALTACHVPIAEAYTRAKTPDGVPVWWKQHAIRFKLDARGSDDAPVAATLEAVRAAIKKWEQPCSPVHFVDEGTATNLVNADDAIVTVKWVESGWCADSKTCRGPAIAWTRITAKASGEIVDADIEINGEMFVFSAEEQPKAGAVDVASVILHEMGHVLGLAHDASGPSVMVDGMTRGVDARRLLSDGDRSFVCDTYPSGAAEDEEKAGPEASAPPPGAACSMSRPDPRGGGAVFLAMIAAACARRSMRRRSDP